MLSLSLLYSLTFGFGVAFLAIQLFLSIDDDMDHETIDSSLDHDGDAHIDDIYHHATDDGAEHINDAHVYEGSASHDHTVDVDALQTHCEEKKVSVLFKTFLFLLKTTRKLTYFSAGFGTMGLVCTFSNTPALLGLIYSLIVGTVSLFLTSILFKFLRPNNKDSRVDTHKLVGCYAEIISKVGYGKDNIGEIKISLDNQILNFYATSKEEGAIFKKGDLAIIYKLDKNGHAVIESENKNKTENFNIENQSIDREV